MALESVAACCLELFVAPESADCDVVVSLNSGSVFVPTPSPAVTSVMTPAVISTATRADTTDTAITPRCTRWRCRCSARPRSTPVSPSARKSCTLRVGVSPNAGAAAGLMTRVAPAT